MALSRLTPDALRANTLAALGVGEVGHLGVASLDALAPALRRAGGFLCPCPPRTLIRHVARSFRGLSPPDVHLEEAVCDALDALVAYGDLLELAAPDEPGGPNRRLLFAAPPTFVRRASGDVYVVGIVPEYPTPLPPALEKEVVADGVARRIPNAPKDLVQALCDLGLVELPDAVWLWAPALESPARHIAGFDALLSKQGPVTSAVDIEVLDFETPVFHYGRRWVRPGPTHSARYIVRRPQLYGAPLWAYAQLDAGRVTRLLDLPVRIDKQAPPDVRACDQAWHLQAAIDANRGAPQRVLLRPGLDGTAYLDLSAPPPAWLARRWTVLGKSAPRSSKALFSFAFSTREADAELRFVRDHLWLSNSDTP